MQKKSRELMINKDKIKKILELSKMSQRTTLQVILIAISRID